MKLLSVILMIGVLASCSAGNNQRILKRCVDAGHDPRSQTLSYGDRVKSINYGRDVIMTVTDPLAYVSSQCDLVQIDIEYIDPYGYTISKRFNDTSVVKVNE